MGSVRCVHAVNLWGAISFLCWFADRVCLLWLAIAKRADLTCGDLCLRQPDRGSHSWQFVRGGKIGTSHLAGDRDHHRVGNIH